MLKRLLVGRPFRSDRLQHTLLPKRIALPVFASDALSSVAYAPDEILLTLSIAGAAAYAISPWIAVAVAVVMMTVVASYRQNVHAYPSGGGDYEVATVNLGPRFGLAVASALLVDYVLTVAVSVSSGVANLGSVVPFVATHKVIIAIVAVVVLTAMNLRGIRESGTAFAVPTYGFMIVILGMVLTGFVRIFLFGDDLQAPSAHLVVEPEPGHEDLTTLAFAFLLLRTFSSGCAALTGVEAISNGVPAFKPPKSKNAATTLLLLGVVAISMIIGIVTLARETDLQFVESPERQIENLGDYVQKTVTVQLAETVFGAGSLLVLLVAGMTALILFLAANTSFNAFPRLAAILAEDGYMPRQFAFRGDRLAYSWGIVLLAAIAFGLLWAFGGDTHALIPLYSVGVFLCFTLSQAGMVKHWREVRESGWQWRLAVNAFGGVLTAVVLGIVVFEKFRDGAYLVVILVPLLVAMMLFINRQYARSKKELAVRPDLIVGPPIREERVVVPIPGLDRATVQAIKVGRSIDEDVRAVFISDDPERAAAVRRDFERQVPGVPLVVVESPYRALAGPLLAYLDVLDMAWPPDKPEPITFVVIPEYVAKSWWERLLYNQSAKRLRSLLLGRPHTVIVNVPYRREDETAAETGPEHTA